MGVEKIDLSSVHPNVVLDEYRTRIVTSRMYNKNRAIRHVVQDMQYLKPRLFTACVRTAGAPRLTAENVRPTYMVCSMRTTHIFNFHLRSVS